MIKHNVRWNDLEMLVFDQKKSELLPINACAVVASRFLAGSQRDGLEFPEHLRLLPEDCLGVYDKLEAAMGARKVRALHPSVFFKQVNKDYTWDISVAQVRAWEAEIKAFLAESYANIESRPSLLKCLGALAEENHKFFESSIAANVTQNASQLDQLTQELGTLLRHLQRDAKLPCIVFHLTRSGNDRFAIQLTKQLAEAQQQARQTPEFKDKIKDLTAQLEAKKVLLAKAKEERPKLELASQVADLSTQIENMMMSVDWKYSLMPVNVLPPTMEEIKEMLKSFDASSDFVVALRHGVGVHHPAMPTDYRQCVEHLFRMKRLGVVFATDTLAYGLNMPCKTVAFAGDSLHLNSMLFRQMSGRAGRRGMDLRGHVVFLQVPRPKVEALVMADLPAVKGSLALSCSLVSRIMTNLSSPELAPLVAGGVHRLVCHPLHHPTPHTPALLSHAFRFCVSQLASMGLINEFGAPNSLGTLVNHLFFLEVSALTFVGLLQSGWFNRVSAMTSVPVQTRDRWFVDALARIFMVRPVSSMSRLQLSKQHKSLIALPPLEGPIGGELDQILTGMTRTTLDRASTFWNVFVQALGDALPPPNVLPVSGIAWPVQPSASTTTPVTLETFNEVTLRSPFSALSGAGEYYESTAELCASTRAGVVLEPKAVPAPPSHTGANAYLLDFFLHGQLDLLKVENGIPEEGMYDTIKEFALVLKAIHAALERRASSPEAPVTADALEGFRRVSTEFAAKFSAAPWERVGN